jgi:hypothetical protein
MKALWKWILLFIGVLVLAFLVALPFFVGRSLGLARLPMIFLFGGGPAFAPALRGGFGILAGLFLFGRLILPLALIVLAAFGLVALLSGGTPSSSHPVAANTATPTAAPVAPAVSTGVTPASSAAVEQTAAASATKPCAHCGSPLQSGWVACPYCGEKV